MSNYEEILDLFVSLVVASNDYTPQGVEKSFVAFCASLRVHDHKPKGNSNAPSDSFVRTTLKDAAQKCKTPIYIIADINKYGNMESADYPGLIFEKDAEGQWVAVGLQDGPKLAPLTTNSLLVAMSNGWRFDKNRVTGSAKLATCDLGVEMPVK